MVFGNYWEAIMLFYDRAAKFDQLRAEAAATAAAKAEAAAIAEQDRKWRGWIARRDAAAKQGLPFTEPPPAPLDD